MKLKDRLYLWAIWLMPIAVALGGCNQQSPDGYTFEKAEYVQTDLRVRTVPVESREALLKLAPPEARAKENETSELMAFGTLSKDGKSCTIYFVDARVNYQPQWIGHELAHCVYGRWHS